MMKTFFCSTIHYTTLHKHRHLWTTR